MYWLSSLKERDWGKLVILIVKKKKKKKMTVSLWLGK